MYSLLQADSKINEAERRTKEGKHSNSPYFSWQMLIQIETDYGQCDNEIDVAQNNDCQTNTHKYIQGSSA